MEWFYIYDFKWTQLLELLQLAKIVVHLHVSVLINWTDRLIILISACETNSNVTLWNKSGSRFFFSLLLLWFLTPTPLLTNVAKDSFCHTKQELSLHILAHGWRANYSISIAKSIRGLESSYWNSVHDTSSQYSGCAVSMCIVPWIFFDKRCYHVITDLF